MPDLSDRVATDRAPSDHVLRTLASVPIAARVLDLGCGCGRHAEALARLGFDVYACDADPDALVTARARAAEVLGDAEAARRVTSARAGALGYADDFFDWVVAHGVYDTADSAADLKDQLGETRRVLKPGGWLIAAFRRDQAGDDLTPETLAKLMAEAGLAVAEEPAEDDDHGEAVVRGIFRKPEERY